MTGNLIFVIGPSGAGKDSVLAGLRSRWEERPQEPRAHWARRTITRPASAHGEQHEAVDLLTFEHLVRKDALGMHWSANGLHYGIRREELRPLQDGDWVFITGSRGYLPTLLKHWPEARVVYIGASTPVLQARLVARGRESEQAIAARIAREVALELPANTLMIQNDGLLEDAVSSLMEQLRVTA